MGDGIKKRDGVNRRADSAVRKRYRISRAEEEGPPGWSSDIKRFSA